MKKCRKLFQTKIVRRIPETKDRHYGDDPEQLTLNGLLFTFQYVNGVWKEKGDGMQDALMALERTGAKHIRMTEVNVNTNHRRATNIRSRLMDNLPSKILMESNLEFDRENFIHTRGIITMTRGALAN